MAFQRFVELAITTKDGESVKINDLRIDFDIERACGAENNRCVVRVFNLTKETSAKITEAGGHILLKAGYKDEATGTIFAGDVLRGSRERVENDYITSLEAYDGRTAVMAGFVSLSYAKDTDALTIAQELLKAIGLAYTGTDLIPSGAKYAHGFCFCGLATEGLSFLLARYGLKFTIQDETLYIFEDGKETERTELSIEEGGDLLTLPQILNEGEKNLYAFQTKLNPELFCGALISVKSSTFKGEVVIKRVHCVGSNMDGDFSAEIEAEVV